MADNGALHPMPLLLLRLLFLQSSMASASFLIRTLDDSSRYELCFSGGKVVENGRVIKYSKSSESGHQKTQNHISHVQAVDRNQEHDSTVDVFRWSRCKKALPQKVMLSMGIPLPLEHVEVLQGNLDWEDVQWSQTGVWVAGKEYDLARAHFLSPS